MSGFLRFACGSKEVIVYSIDTVTSRSSAFIQRTSLFWLLVVYVSRSLHCNTAGATR